MPSEAWNVLLRSLSLSDEEIAYTITGVCRGVHQLRASEDLCDAVINEVYIAVFSRFETCPDDPCFKDKLLFMRYIRKTARHARGVDIQQWYRRPIVGFVTTDAIVELPESPAYNPSARKHLSSNQVCEELLEGASETVRNIAYLLCEGLKLADIARELKMPRATLYRRVEELRSHLEHKLGIAFSGPTTGEDLS